MTTGSGNVAKHEEIRDHIGATNKMVQRYTLDATMEPDDNGGWVTVEDYERLRKHAERLAKDLMRISGMCDTGSNRHGEQAVKVRADKALAAYHKDHPEGT